MKSLPFRSLFAVALLGLRLSVAAQLAPPEPQPVYGARMPSMGPNGQRLAFAWRGDIWVAPAEGGRATPITHHVATDAHPVFGPNGDWVAFASKRYGNWDLLLVPAAGGATRRLTWHSDAEIPFGWTPDGKELLFEGRRDSENYALYAVNVKTLRTRLLAEDYAKLHYPACAPDGKRLVYTRYGFDWSRPRYEGSAAAQAWMLDLKSGESHPLTGNGHQHLWTQFLGAEGDLVTVTVGEGTPSSSPLDHFIPKIQDNAQRTPNLWRLSPDGKRRPLTEFVGGSVRWPSVALKTGDIAFEQGADLWLLKQGEKKPRRLIFTASADEKENHRKYEELDSDVVEAEPSPDGTMLAMGIKGDIWTVAIRKPSGVKGRSEEYAKQLTFWEGDDSDFSWAPDGKSLFFVSDRAFNSGVYQVDLATLETRPVWQEDRDVTYLRVSPDGHHLSFWVTGSEGGLFIHDLESGHSRRLVKVPGPQWRGYGGGDFNWSPDSKWIAFTRRGENAAWNIWLVPASGGEPVNITRLNAIHGEPVWSPDGKYLFFTSNREGDGIYVLPLLPEVAREGDVDIRFEKPEDDVEVKIDFRGLTDRIRRIVSASGVGDLLVTKQGSLLFRSGGNIRSASYDGKSTKTLTSEKKDSLVRVTRDGSFVTFTRSGRPHRMSVTGGGVTRISFTADWERDVRAERLAAFTEFWRSYDRGFYDPNFHGRDWEAIRLRYEPLLDAVATPDEFATLLKMMVGELESSHSEVTAAKETTDRVTTPHLGFTIDYAHPGPGIKVREVPESAPGSFRQTRIEPGEYVLEIDGDPVEPNERLYALINHKDGRELEFLVNDSPVRDGARRVKYQALSSGEWRKLNYENRVRDRRRHVENATDGRIGYLHIPGMGSREREQFEREAYEYILGKEAMILDVRFNGGGNISDTLIDWLERKPHGFMRPRDGVPLPAPARAWNKPVVVLMNEHSYSNAEMFAYAMRARGLAKLVGMPTPGYVIWTSSLSLVDGTGARMPQAGVYRLDGTPQENRGEIPDYQVNLTPEDWLKGRDPQLDKAIELLLPAPTFKPQLEGGP